MHKTADKQLQEKCGVFGIYAAKEEVARLAFFGLHALQHRGQESAGIATSDGHEAHIYKAMGLVNQVFNEENLATLPGYLAIGHTRYSTTGASQWRNAQPLLIETFLGSLGIAHNGNLTNVPILRRELLQKGVGLTTSSDTEVIIQLLAGGEGDWLTRFKRLMQQARGAYSLTILTKNALYGLRDPWGFRPLCIGDYKGKGYVLASESCALATIGATFIDEVKPGEVICINDQGISRTQSVPAQQVSLCTFEHVYFSRPDSAFQGKVIHQTRQQLGRILAREAPTNADVVISIPDSGTPAAIGYAQEMNLPFTEGLTKNRYIARTFIQPSDELRKNSVSLKFNPLPDNLKDKRVVVVDDSIVRGNTIGPLVKMIRDAGATEVHVRISSPPIKYPCFMGVDMAAQDELVAFSYSVEEICQHVGADSLAYLTIEGMMEAITVKNTAKNRVEGMVGSNGYCNACFSGKYPLELDSKQIKEVVG